MLVCVHLHFQGRITTARWLGVMVSLMPPYAMWCLTSTMMMQPSNQLWTHTE